MNSPVKRENSKVDEINHCLLGLCCERGYYFLDNSNISRDKLNWDGLHLNKAGDAIFFNNLLKTYKLLMRKPVGGIVTMSFLIRGLVLHQIVHYQAVVDHLWT